MDGNFWRWKLKVSLRAFWSHFRPAVLTDSRATLEVHSHDARQYFLVAARDNVAHDHAMTSESARVAQDYQLYDNKSTRIQQLSTHEVDSINSYRHQWMRSRGAYEYRQGLKLFAEKLKRPELKLSGSVEQGSEKEDC